MGEGTQTLAIIFADISRSSRLYKAIGDTLALEKVSQCMELLTQIIVKNNGLGRETR